MNLVESFRIALRALTANKMRSILTMLGIIIGVGAVITLMSVGKGVQAMIAGQLQSAGSNLLIIVPGNFRESQPGDPRLRRPSKPLTTSDWLAIRDPLQAPHLLAVAPEADGQANVTFGKTSISVPVVGTNEDYSFVRDFHAADGRFINDEDVTNEARVAVLGINVADKLFPNGEYPIGQSIRIKNIPFRVVGVMEKKGGGSFGNFDDVVIVPFTTAQARLFPYLRSSRGEPTLSIILAKVDDEKNLKQAATLIEDLLRTRHEITYLGEDDFSVINQSDILDIASSITKVLTTFLESIAGISLLVGGIGIMNIMLVSVTERTREIGLRKAVGAKRRDILLQFLVEAMVLSLMGGIIGIILGYLGALVIATLSKEFAAIVSIQSILFATGFSALVGLFFGSFPALRAARLHPIDALRYE